MRHFKKEFEIHNIYKETLVSFVPKREKDKIVKSG